MLLPMCRFLVLRSLPLAATAVCALAGCRGDSEAPTAAVITQLEIAQATKKPTQPREPIDVDWERLSMELGEENKFEPWMVPSRVQELDGKRIRVKGLIYAGALWQRGNIREFPLIRELGCQFGNGAPAWHVIMVELEGKLRTEYKAEQITVEGKFQVKPYNGPDGKTWSVYFLQGTKVE